MAAKLTHKQVIAALDRLEKGWPDDLLLFSWSGTLCLIHVNDAVDAGLGVFEDDIIWNSCAITNEGGDPDNLPGSAFDEGMDV
jgi:hypothetical protein